MWSKSSIDLRKVENLSEDEYYDMLYQKHEENKANSYALIDKSDFEIINYQKEE